jgi:dolichyl-phosphate-mannose-protein mannosyltransferase
VTEKQQPIAAPQQQPPTAITTKSKNKSKNKVTSYQSEGVEDNDVFLLPVSDYWVVLALMVLATVVRVYKIYQPTSVVFDEVQCVSPAICSFLTAPVHIFLFNALICGFQ